MACTIVCGYIEPDVEHEKVFTETLSVEGFQKHFPNGVFLDCPTMSRMSGGDCREEGYTWVHICVRNGRLWMEWGEPAA